MIYVLTLIGACFVTAYGNAMRKVTYRRAALALEGKETAGTSVAYFCVGLVLFYGGVLLLIAWALWTVGVI